MWRGDTPHPTDGGEVSEVRFLPEREAAGGGVGLLRELLAPLAGALSTGPRDIVAVKIHPGESGNTSFVGAGEVSSVVEALDLPPDRIFLTDTTVLYPGRRRNAPDLLRLVREHGFGPPATPPFVVADGLRGELGREVPVGGGRETATAMIAESVCAADAVVFVSHFKGHLLSGFGGAVKNLGMGCATRAGKLFQHSSVVPSIDADSCTGCGACAAGCPEGAISVDGSAAIEPSSCVGCGECLERCPEGSVRVVWDVKMDRFMRRMVEYAVGASGCIGRAVYVNFLRRVVPDCDCMHDTGAPLVGDIGVLASTDPVALDMACLDLVTGAEPSPEGPVADCPAGADKLRCLRPEVDGAVQLHIAEEMGLGSVSYDLVTVER